MNKQTCDASDCKKPAKFRTARPDKHQLKNWCEKHLADKVGKYEMEVLRIK